MYRNSRSNSLLEWKIIADQEAEDYLLQSFLKKVEEKKPKDKKHASNWGQPNKTKTINTTRATRYVEGKEKDKPKEEVFEEKHDNATNMRQYGGEYNSGFRKEPKNNTTKEQSSNQDKNIQPRNNTKHQEMKTITSRDIMSMVKKWRDDIRTGRKQM